MRRSSSSKSKKKNKSAELKVVYISSPMKVKTCAANFRSTVQQLTGRDSDLVDRLMDEHANNNNTNVNLNNEVLLFDGDDPTRVAEIPETTVSNESYESPTSTCGAMDAMFSNVGDRGVDAGFSFEEIFGAGGFLLECPVDESALFGFGGI